MKFSNLSKPYSLRLKLKFAAEDPNDKIWHRNRKIRLIIFFQMNIKLSSSLGTFRRFQKTILEGCATQIFTK